MLNSKRFKGARRTITEIYANKKGAKRLPKINRHVISSSLNLQFNEKQYLAHDPYNRYPTLVLNTQKDLHDHDMTVMMTRCHTNIQSSS